MRGVGFDVRYGGNRDWIRASNTAHAPLMSRVLRVHSSARWRRCSGPCDVEDIDITPPVVEPELEHMGQIRFVTVPAQVKGSVLGGVVQSPSK